MSKSQGSIGSAKRIIRLFLWASVHVLLAGVSSFSAAAMAPNGVVNIRDYGATGDGVTDDGAAIRAASTVIQAAGKGTLYFPNGDYLVFKVGTVYRTLVQLSDCDGVRIRFEDRARLLVDSNRKWTGEYGSLFYFTDCSHVHFEGRIIAEGPYSELFPASGAGNPYGVGLARFMGNMGGKDISLPYARIKNMAFGVLFNNGNPTPGLYSHVRIGTLDAEGISYGISGANVDNLDAQLIRTNRVGRSYFFYNFKNHTVNVESKDPQMTDINITCYDASHVNSGLKLRYTNHDSTNATSAPWIQLNWFGYDERGGLYTAGQMTDIDISVDVKFNGNYGGGSLIGFEKYTDSNHYPAIQDPDDRHRVLDNFSLSGVVRGAPDPAAGLLGFTNTNWGDTTRPGYTPANGDRFSHFRIRDLQIDKSVGSVISLSLNCFTDMPRIERVEAPNTYININNGLIGGIIKNPKMPALYRNVVLAGTIGSGDGSNPSKHIYEDSAFSASGSRYLSRINKEFRNTAWYGIIRPVNYASNVRTAVTHSSSGNRLDLYKSPVFAPYSLWYGVTKAMRFQAVGSKTGDHGKHIWFTITKDGSDAVVIDVFDGRVTSTTNWTVWADVYFRPDQSVSIVWRSEDGTTLRTGVWNGGVALQNGELIFKIQARLTDPADSVAGHYWHIREEQARLSPQ